MSFRQRHDGPRRQSPATAARPVPPRVRPGGGPRCSRRPRPPRSPPGRSSSRCSLTTRRPPARRRPGATVRVPTIPSALTPPGPPMPSSMPPLASSGRSRPRTPNRPGPSGPIRSTCPFLRRSLPLRRRWCPPVHSRPRSSKATRRASTSPNWSLGRCRHPAGCSVAAGRSAGSVLRSTATVNSEPSMPSWTSSRSRRRRRRSGACSVCRPRPRWRPRRSLRHHHLRPSARARRFHLRGRRWPERRCSILRRQTDLPARPRSPRCPGRASPAGETPPGPGPTTRPAEPPPIGWSRTPGGATFDPRCAGSGGVDGRAALAVAEGG